MAHLGEYQRAQFLSKHARPEMHAQGAAALRSLTEFLRKRVSKREFQAWAKGARFVCVDFAGVLYVEGAENLRGVWQRALEWAAGPGALVGFTGVESVTFSDRSEETQMRELTDAVEVTQEQLRSALVSLLGSSAQTTARDFRSVLPKHHKPIAWEAWKAAAEAEGLQVEGEKPWGITIWRKGAAKMPAPAIAIPTASTPQQQGAASVPDNAQKIAASARAYMDAQRKAGREVSATDAVHAVMKQGAGSK